jgi:hypothetical protein
MSRRGGCRWRVLAVGVATTTLAMMTAASSAANAQTTYPPVVDRDFNIDLFEQPAIGSPRLIAMAGAVNSVAEGAAGLYTNPASAAVRPQTKTEKFAWNLYFNSYVPVDGQDANNNGQPVTSLRRSLLGGAGVMLQYGKWGLTLDGGYTAHEIAPEAGGGLGVRSLIAHLGLARTFVDEEIAIGVGLRAGALNVYTLEMQETLFTRAGVSGEAGAVWKPRERSFRLAISGALPVFTGALDYTCDPNNCAGYILPSDAVVPWQATLGAAWRFGPTPWNHKLEGTYRDERQLTVAVDLGFTGAVSNGFGMEAFAAKQLQASGRDITVTPRLGLESEIIRGWLRLRAGGYLEPSRFIGVTARWHGTAGAEGRLFAFRLFGEERRVSLSVAGDFAARYKNAGISLGFWN